MVLIEHEPVDLDKCELILPDDAKMILMMAYGSGTHIHVGAFQQFDAKTWGECLAFFASTLRHMRHLKNQPDAFDEMCDAFNNTAKQIKTSNED